MRSKHTSWFEAEAGLDRAAETHGRDTGRVPVVTRAVLDEIIAHNDRAAATPGQMTEVRPERSILEPFPVDEGWRGGAAPDDARDIDPQAATQAVRPPLARIVLHREAITVGPIPAETAAPFVVGATEKPIF